jgi:leucyl/phenylalanyl-tRNA--protein transferase
MHEPNGLLAIGGSLSPAWLISAYRHGIFPWFGEDDPILWWSPDPRGVLWPHAFHASRRLQRSIRSRGYRSQSNRAFTAVLDGCAAPRGPHSGTWITASMRAAYIALHRLGVAHSVEIYQQEQLVGGLYGVQVGGVFFAESMFSGQTDASKAALLALVGQAKERGIELIDTQIGSPHVASLGGTVMPRSAFLTELTRLIEQPTPPWPRPPA